MYSHTKTHIHKGCVVQQVGIPRLMFGGKFKVETIEHRIDSSDLYEFTRIRKLHNIRTKSNKLVQVSGSYKYCKDWWDENNLQKSLTTLPT